MTVYAELLKLALAEHAEHQPSVDEMVSEVLARRQGLAVAGDAATRLAASLAYDTAIVHLCRRLGVENDLTGATAGPEARRRAERALAAMLPKLEAALR